MAAKRPDRTARRERERTARKLVREREKLALLVPGGSEDRPIEVVSPAVIDSRVGSMKCPQCEGSYTIDDHAAPSAGLRRIAVTCRLCHVKRALWFRLGVSGPN
ncbi:MAG: hypothetical protein K8W52_30810 [Deltaproteobacteria bacterium]|nr:hypothetical protein [Deltaproteobacteria bacterium]